MIHQEWAFLSMPKDQLVEIHRALLTRYVVESALRREQGLEAIDYPPFLEHMEKMLGISEDEAHTLFHKLEDELWEYSWYDYTDEWAWFRAKQDVMKGLKHSDRRVADEEMDRLVEKKYEEKFESYVAEVDMKEESGGKQKKSARAPKK